MPLAGRKLPITEGVVLECAALRKRHVRHEPEKTVLYEVVLGWLETFLAYARETYERAIPRYVERELRRFIDCGIFNALVVVMRRIRGQWLRIEDHGARARLIIDLATAS
jgi:hypothetical protein